MTNAQLITKKNPISLFKIALKSKDMSPQATKVKLMKQDATETGSNFGSSNSNMSENVVPKE